MAGASRVSCEISSAKVLLFSHSNKLYINKIQRKIYFLIGLDLP